MSKEISSIAILCPSLDLGGAERVSVNLANQFVSRNIQVYFILFHDVGVFKDQLSDRVEVFKLGKSRSRFALFSLYNALLKIQPQFLISTLRAGSIASGLVFRLPFLKSTFIIREAGLYHPENGGKSVSGFLRKLAMKLAYRSAKGLIANSPGTAESLVNNGMIAGRAKKTVIGNPVLQMESLASNSTEASHQWLDSADFQVIINAARLHPIKDHENLLRAFAMVLKKKPGVRLILLGEGPERTKIEVLIELLNLSDHVALLGYQSDPMSFFRKSDLFVLSSVSEGFGNVVVEALQSKLPVICTDCDGPRYILENGKYGKLVPIGDTAALANAITGGLNKPESVNIEASFERASDFTATKIADRYLSYLQECFVKH